MRAGAGARVRFGRIEAMIGDDDSPAEAAKTNDHGTRIRPPEEEQW